MVYRYVLEYKGIELETTLDSKNKKEAEKFIKENKVDLLSKGANFNNSKIIEEDIKIIKIEKL